MITFRSLITSLGIVITQSMLPLVYLKYVRVEVEEAEEKIVSEKIGKPLKAELSVLEAEAFTPKKLVTTHIVVAIDANGKPVQELTDPQKVLEFVEAPQIG